MPAPTRRSVLRGLAGAAGLGAVAGCITGGRLRRYRVLVDDVPAALPATVAVRAVETPTRKWPLTLEVEFASTADEPTTFAVDAPGAFPFGRTVARNRAPSTRGPETPSGPQRVVLADAGGGTFDEGCWTAAPMPSATGEPPGDDAGPHRVRLSPGESVTVERAVLNHEGNTVCYPIGRYRFPVAYRWEGSSNGSGDAVPWGFVLEISDLRPDE